MMDMNMHLSQWPTNFWIKQLQVEQLKMRIFQTKELAKELHDPFIKKIKKINTQSSFIDNIWGTDHTDM